MFSSFDEHTGSIILKIGECVVLVLLGGYEQQNPYFMLRKTSGFRMCRVKVKGRELCDKKASVESFQPKSPEK